MGSRLLAAPALPVTLPPAIHIQLGLFGAAEIVGMHVVSSHTRTLEDGSEVFVGEHVRWNQGRRHRPAAAPAPPRPTLPTEEIEVFPGAFQLPLWGQ